MAAVLRRPCRIFDYLILGVGGSGGRAAEGCRKRLCLLPNHDVLHPQWSPSISRTSRTHYQRPTSPTQRPTF